MIFNTLSTTILAVFLSGLVSSIRLSHRNLNAEFLPCYDYIIAGGGVSGLVLANRLSEDPTVSVLVIEAGSLDNDEDFILYPFDAGDGLATSYDWNLWTAPQTHLDGASRPFDLGKGIGGGSLINGMCWTRGGSADYDAWVALGNPGWGWDDMLPYFKKTEHYTDDVDAEFSHDLYINPDADTHGTTGYIDVSYPKYFYPQSKQFLDGLQELGIPTLTDPNNGTTAGGMLIPNNISPDNQTRSDARRGYYNEFINRPNLHVATGFVVIRVLIDSDPDVLPRDLPAGQFITGVQIAPALSTVVREISCSREVILAAGNAHTPQILELSGIGQAAILESLGLPVHIDLQGVGENFQDHPYVGVIYYYTNSSYPTVGSIDGDQRLLTQVEQEYYVNKTGPWTAGAINTVAFPSFSQLTANWTNRIADAKSQIVTDYLTPGLDSTVISGYAAQKDIILDLLSRPDASAYELLNDNIGLLSVAAMHPLSRGSIHITTDNPYVPPEIDPRYGSNPLDIQTLIDALMFNNKLLQTESMKLLQPEPYYPFLADATPEILTTAIKSGLRTEFHGGGATSMMPRELGGVVDPDLRVYGTKNLRIVDAGIIPMLPASHLQAPIYAIAEKAADLIKRDNYGLTPQGCGIDSSFASPGPVLSKLSFNSLKNSSSVPQSSASTPKVESLLPTSWPSVPLPSVTTSLSTLSTSLSASTSVHSLNISTSQVGTPVASSLFHSTQISLAVEPSIVSLTPPALIPSSSTQVPLSSISKNISSTLPTSSSILPSGQVQLPPVLNNVSFTGIGSPGLRISLPAPSSSPSASSNGSSSPAENTSSQLLPGIGSPELRPSPIFSNTQTEKISTQPSTPDIESPALKNDSESGSTSPGSSSTITSTPESATSSSDTQALSATSPSSTITESSVSSPSTTIVNALASVAAVFGLKDASPVETVVPQLHVAGEDVAKPIITAPATILDILPASAQMFSPLQGSSARSMVASMLEIKYAAAAASAPKED